MEKHKCFFDFAKEEQWLAEMAEKGFAFVYVNCCGKYSFKTAEPHRFNYRIDYRIFKNSNDFNDYCTLFADSGWKHICGTKNSGTQYFVQLNPDAATDIFSDVASKAGRYKRFFSMWLTLCITYFPIVTVLFTTNTIKTTAFTNPKALYYTPGLWSLHGVDFWRAFLFETPFAVLRGYLWLIVFAVMLFYMFFSLKAYLLYRRYSKPVCGEHTCGGQDAQ